MPPEVESAETENDKRDKDKEGKEGKINYTFPEMFFRHPFNPYFYGRDEKIDLLSKELSDVKEEYKKALADSEIKVAKLNASFNNLQTDMEKLSNDKSSYLLFFGLFASIISFFSIELQIFRTVDSFWKVVGISMIFLSLLLTFNIVIYHLSLFQQKERKYKIGNLFLILGFIFGFGIIFSLLDRIDAVQKWPPSEIVATEFLEKQKLHNATFFSKIDSAFILLDSIDSKLEGIGKKQK